jgi:hypothetical protein
VADTASHDNTGWTPFLDYCIERADKIPISDPVARMQEAERLVLEQVLRGELEIRWYDVDGRGKTGLPGGVFGFGIRYDSYRDAIFEPLPITKRVLYRPQVRRRKKTANTLTAKPAVESPAPLTEPTPESDHKPNVPDRPANEAMDTLPTGSAKTAQWPWEVTPDEVGETTQVARCRNDLAKHFQPSEILRLNTPEVKAELAKKSCGYDDTTIRRALLRKKDRMKKPKQAQTS